MKITVFTGAGVSKESGLQTFRDGDGLWNGYNVYDVATYDAFCKDPKMVLDFYNMRRAAVVGANPNAAHLAIASLQKDHDVTIITQNIDDLHERAGSDNVIHIHGELLYAKPDNDSGHRYRWTGDLNVGDVCERTGAQLRPDIVWFGEGIYDWMKCIGAINCDVFIVCGTSAQVFPAASLIGLTKATHKFLVDPNPPDVPKDFIVVAKPASTGMQEVVGIIGKL